MYNKRSQLSHILIIVIILSFGTELFINNINVNKENREEFTSLTKASDIFFNAEEETIIQGTPVMRTTDGYNWWYYVPNSLKKFEICYILLEQSHLQTEDYEYLTNDAQKNSIAWKSIAEEKKYILLTVALPRNFSHYYYPQALDKNSFEPSTPEFYYRPDLKVNNIISELIQILRNAEFFVMEKILVAGFSAGGMWANRYTILHPERVKAAAIGQAGGWLTIPIYEYNETILLWPMGIANFKNLTGTEYNKQKLLKNVPQFIFIGDQDNSNTYASEPWPTEDEIKIWGATDPERLENQSLYLKNSGYNVKFKLYSGIGHTFTLEMKNDIIQFFDSVINISIPSYHPIILLQMIIVLSIILIIFFQKKIKIKFR